MKVPITASLDGILSHSYQVIFNLKDSFQGHAFEWPGGVCRVNRHGRPNRVQFVSVLQFSSIIAYDTARDSMRGRRRLPSTAARNPEIRYTPRVSIQRRTVTTDTCDNLHNGTSQFTGKLAEIERRLAEGLYRYTTFFETSLVWHFLRELVSSMARPDDYRRRYTSPPDEPMHLPSLSRTSQKLA